MRNEWFDDGEGHAFRWPFCTIPGCPNRICLAKGETRFCWPHSEGDQTLGEMLAEHGVKVGVL